MSNGEHCHQGAYAAATDDRADDDRGAGEPAALLFPRLFHGAGHGGGAAGHDPAPAPTTSSLNDLAAQPGQKLLGC